MKLRKLLDGVEYRILKGNIDSNVTALVYDSRKVTAGCLFLCISGTSVDAHQFIPDAVEKGAGVIVTEREIKVEGDVTVLCVPSARKALAYFSAAYFGHPAKELVCIGITGTKGKTTTSYMLQEILEAAGKKVGVIGTIGAVIAGERVPTKNTTPESYEIQKLFRRMAEAGCEYVIMEVSSQGLKMDRVAGFEFDYGVFTNFSPDHIGPTEHASMEEYLACKNMLFRQCHLGIINRDDKIWEKMIENHSCEIETYGFSKEADFRAKNMEFINGGGFLGMGFETEGILDLSVRVNIPGRFSVYNSMVALCLGYHLGIPEEIMLETLKHIVVRGRVELVYASNFTVLIDYAHNAVSTESLLTTLREYHPKRLICVYGCGGNRSKLRRYDMGENAGRLADLSILTCDNPRFEEIADINNDIKVGLEKSNGKYIEIFDREEAIRYSIENAEPGDMIVLLGKGHEDYQEIKGKKYHFDEREVVKKVLAECNVI